MELSKKLAEVKAQVAEAIGAEESAVLQEEIARMTETIALDARKIGDTAPDFVLSDGEGNSHDLETMLAQGMLVISFNRGAWCPYCQQEIIALQTSMGLMNDVDVNALVISPFRTEYWKGYRDENGIDVPILHDEENRTAEAYGVGFTESEALQHLHKDLLSMDFKDMYGEAAGKLPVPAIYVVNREKEIVYAYINPDWQERANPNDYCSAVTGTAVS